MARVDIKEYIFREIDRKQVEYPVSTDESKNNKQKKPEIPNVLPITDHLRVKAGLPREGRGG